MTVDFPRGPCRAIDSSLARVKRRIPGMFPFSRPWSFDRLQLRSGSEGPRVAASAAQSGVQGSQVIRGHRARASGLNSRSASLTFMEIGKALNLIRGAVESGGPRTLYTAGRVIRVCRAL